jgi:hypothetical protein
VSSTLNSQPVGSAGGVADALDDDAPELATDLAELAPDAPELTPDF